MMPPKKTNATKTSSKKDESNHAAPKRAEKSKQEDLDSESKESSPKPQTNGTSKKRKSPSSSTTDSKPAPKVPRKGTRTTSRSSTTTSTPSPTPSQILNYLFSAQSLPLCYPSEELASSSTNKTYSRTSPTRLSAFEHLLTSSLLSKPLSHALGMRSVRTLLNPPFNLNTAAQIVQAGEKRVWEALEVARTQHRQKTATYIYSMAGLFEDGKAMTRLQERANEEGVTGVQKWIKANVKGMAVTGAEIFCRRIQCVDGWGDRVWPFADSRAIEAMRALGLDVKDSEALEDLIERCVDWEKVGDIGVDVSEGDVDMEQQVQVEFVVCLERAIGASLEGNIEEIKREAAKF